MTKFTKITGKITLGIFIAVIVGFTSYELLRKTSLIEGNFLNVVFVLALYCLLLGIFGLAIFLILLIVNLVQKKRKSKAN